MSLDSFEMPSFDIVIPHYGTGRLTQLCQRCLETIRHHSSDYRLIFIDNGSPEFDQIKPEVQQHPHLLVRNIENAGFIKATNQGLWLSTAPYVVLMNNDTEAVEGWLESLKNALVGNIGMAGPLMALLSRVPAGSRANWQSGWRPRNRDRVFILPKSAMLAFFCVMIRRDVIDRVGVLDESYGVGLADDDDYCRRVHRAGFDLALVQDLRIPHHHRSTFRTLYSEPEILRMQRRALSYFHYRCRSR